MSMVLGLVDPVADRREMVLDRAAALISSTAVQPMRTWRRGTLTVLAATGPATPVEEADDGGCWAWVLGDLHPGDGPSASHGALALARAGNATSINGLDGYYLAAVVGPTGTITLGTDMLGLFPLYYWSTAEVFAFSTVPGLFRAHPLCNAGLSEHGLAGILLLGHMANGQTIWKGVRRAEPGHALRWSPGAEAACVAANALEPSEAYFGRSYPEVRALFGEALCGALRRVAARYQGGVRLMLSGGLDSRLVAAYLHSLAPGLTTSLIFGDPTDRDVRLARRVTRALGMPSTRAAVRLSAFASLAAESVRREQLCNTLFDFSWLSRPDVLTDSVRPIVNGLWGDHAWYIPSAFDKARGLYTFDTWFRHRNAFGFSPDDAAAIIPSPRGATVVREVIEGMRSRFDALPGLPFQKSWLWELYHRCRFHVAPYAWRLSMLAWPVMPYNDRKMLEIAAGAPLTYVADRRWQVDTLKSDFTHLARLPLDYNAVGTTLLLPPWHHPVTSRLAAAAARLRPPVERRTFVRTFDVNNAGWRAVRVLAEAYRGVAGSLVRPDALARWLPPPSETIAFRDATVDAGKWKILLALTILAGQEQEVGRGDVRN